jgi:hypothetical protein
VLHGRMILLQYVERLSLKHREANSIGSSVTRKHVTTTGGIPKITRIRLLLPPDDAVAIVDNSKWRSRRLPGINRFRYRVEIGASHGRILPCVL